MHIRQANLADLEVIVPLFDGYRQFYRQPSDIEGARAFIKSRLENNESIIYLAFAQEDALPIAFTQLYRIFSSVSMERMYLLNDLFVVDTYRGRGAGKALIDIVKERCRNEGQKGIVLQTETTNPAQKLYERLGFTKDPDLHYFWATKLTPFSITNYYPMRIDIITVVPELLKSPFEASIMQRSIAKGLVEVYFHNLRDYSSNSYKQVDDYQFGGGAGMVLMIEPIDKCITALKNERDYDEVIYMTPDGETLNQGMANTLSLKGNIIILCGHYKGVDQRVRDQFVTKEISVGDYVLSGGELGALILCDAVIRLIPGVLGNETSALTDSFQDNLLAPPIYTRPATYKGWQVPPILLSGHTAKIEQWREEEAYKHTKLRRPDLLDE